ncbi:MAG: Abi family protein [Lachnospiraceae bacterium]
MQKTFTSFSQQIDMLQKDKKITIVDTDYAEYILRRIGYFPLMGGYKHLFRIPFTKKHKDGTTFEEIVSLYEFDAELRELFFKYLLQIERYLRSLMSFYFSEQYGESQSAYLNINSFNNTRRNHLTATRLIKALQRAVTTTDYVYINYYRTTYGNIPLWVLINVLTFGHLSKMYQVFPQSLQFKICKNIGPVNQKQMGQFLSILTKFRNVCAHGERLFTYKTVDDISDLPIHKKLNIPLDKEQYIYGKKDLYAAVITFRYLLTANEFKTFKRKLGSLISHLNQSVIHISEAELLHQMGFPPNWNHITRYRLTP